MDADFLKHTVVKIKGDPEARLYFVVSVYLDPNHPASGPGVPLVRVLLRDREGAHDERLATDVVYVRPASNDELRRGGRPDAR